MPVPAAAAARKQWYICPCLTCQASPTPPPHPACLPALPPAPPSYVIGGNGGNAAAHAISKECAAQGVVCNVVGVPKSIDNDIQLVRCLASAITAAARRSTSFSGPVVGPCVQQPAAAQTHGAPVGMSPT